MSQTVFFALIVFFPKRKVFFEVAFHLNVGVRFFIFSGFMFPFIMSIMALNEIVIMVTFYFFFMWYDCFLFGHIHLQFPCSPHPKQ